MNISLVSVRKYISLNDYVLLSYRLLLVHDLIYLYTRQTDLYYLSKKTNVLFKHHILYIFDL